MRSGIETYTGRWFDPGNPRVADVCIEDIAHALACTARFGGHIRKPYSVAQHSVLCSKMAPDGLELQALLHDAHEAYILDMPRPIKALLPDYQAMERRVEQVVRAALRIPATLDTRVKEVDIRMLTTEAKSFGLSWWDWWPECPPFAELGKLEPWPWAKAKQRFLDRFNALGG